MMRACGEDDKRNTDVHVDSDWAGGLERKSRSGGMTTINGTVVKQWPRTPLLALSAAEGTMPLSLEQLRSWECNSCYPRPERGRIPTERKQWLLGEDW